MLTKTTNVLLIPVIFGALLWRWFEEPKKPRSRWAARMGLILGLSAVVCGWHYARVWLHYGNPLIGNWDPQTGFAWWQEDGYRTSAYYLRFGGTLRIPWYAGFKSFGDGIYATLWGDSLLGSAGDFSSRPPWNYDLMAIGYWLSLLPSMAILVGAFLALFKFISQPSAEWFLLVGFGFLVAVALVYVSLVVPCGGMSKAFYGLPALVPFCVFATLGLDFLAGWNRKLRFLLCVLFGGWAINSYASFWVLRSSDPYALTCAKVMATEGEVVQAAELLKARLEFKPRAAELRLMLVSVLLAAGDLDEAERQVQIAAQQQPADGAVWLMQAGIFAQRQQRDKAIEAARRSVELAPGNGAACEQLAGLLMEQKRYEEAALIARQGLGMAPFKTGLRVALGSALLFWGQESEASVQFQYAYALDPDSANRLTQLAWKLATSEDSAERNCSVAVRLAEQACVLTEYRTSACMGALAAAYAEAGRYEEAIKTAERARASAVAAGDSYAVAKTQDLIDLFKSGRPYREGKR